MKCLPLEEVDRVLERQASFLGLRPWELKRMEPREIWALADGDARRFSRIAELAAWGVWLVVMYMPFVNQPDEHRDFRTWLKEHRPPGFKPEPEEG